MDSFERLVGWAGPRLANESRGRSTGRVSGDARGPHSARLKPCLAPAHPTHPGMGNRRTAARLNGKRRDADLSAFCISGPFAVGFASGPTIGRKSLVRRPPKGPRRGYFLRTSFICPQWLSDGLPSTHATPATSMWSSSTNVSVDSCMCMSFAGSKLVPPAKAKRILFFGVKGRNRLPANAGVVRPALSKTRLPEP